VVARYRPKGVGLERVLDTRALAATAYGDVGSSIYYALGLVAIFALGMTPIVFLIAGLFFVMTAMTYAEATANFPEAGGASSFARRAFNELASFVAGWAQILNYVITVSISAFFVPHYLSVFWAPLAHSPGDVVAGIAIVLSLTAVNVIGVRESARLNFVLAATDYATQLLLVALGVFLVLDFGTLIHNIHLGVAPKWDQLAVSVPVAMISYTGLETISNMSEESRSPRTLVPRAYKVLVVAVLSIYALLPAVALSALPVTGSGGHYSTELATKFSGDPILGIVENLSLGFLQQPMRIYVGILAATILIVAANAGTIGVSRLTYSLGQHRQLPERLRHISPRSRTPVVALIAFAVLASLAMVPGKETFLGNMYAFGAMLSFTTAHVSLIGLRWRLARNRMRKLPGDVEVVDGEEEWYLAPFNVTVRGVRVPLFAVFGGLLTATAWVTVMALHTDVLLAGMAWLVFGISTYVVYRRRKGLSLTQTSRVEERPSLEVAPVQYASVLVAFEEARFSETALVTALKLASHRHGDVRVLVTLAVPQHLDLRADLGAAEATARELIEAVRQWARRGQRVHGTIAKVRPGEAGHRIVAEAVRAKAEAIVMPMPRRRPPGRLLDDTLEVVLRKRPCRVLIDSVPARPFELAKSLPDGFRDAVPERPGASPPPRRRSEKQPADRFSKRP
jgi:APA family basic amino acid/polyamine antiporter